VCGFISPLHAASPVAWFKADSITEANHAAVTRWADSSGKGHLATRGPAAPTFSASGMNGSPALHFNGTQTMVFARPVQDDFTIMVLFKTAAGAGGSYNFYSGSGLVSGETPGVTHDFGISIRDNGRIMAGTGDPDVTIRNTATNYADNQPHIITFTRTRATGALCLYVDRELRATATAGTQSLNAFPQLAIGAHPGPVGPFLNGDIAEIIIFDGTLTASEVVTTEDALRGKYALTNGTAPLTPTQVTADGSHLSWSEAPGAKTYQILRADSATGVFEVIAEDLTTNTFTDLSAVAGQTWFYQVVAVNAVGASLPPPAVEGSPPVLPANGPLVFNEIHYNGLNNVVRSDFIELYNYSATAVDLSGWRLSSGVDYIFPPGTSIAAGGYLVIAEHPATVASLWGTTPLGPYSKSLSSDGETLRLRNNADVIVAEITYRSGFPWPCAANGEGASAELIHPTLEPALGSSWRASVTPLADLTREVATPGTRNLQFRSNPPPNIEAVSHTPQQPASHSPITVTVRLSDADGVASATLAYQLVEPGNHIPAYLPLPIVNHQIDTRQPRPANPAFEDPANWSTLAMTDDGTAGDAAAGDGIYTAVIPAQAHRTLVRYRITASDATGTSARAPFDDDPSKNFSCFVYDGVPDYQGISATTLQTLPVYHFLSRKIDYDQCVAYNSNDQLSGNTPSWNFENWDATVVFDGVVYDHIQFRLHGGNGRYYHTSKRGFRFFFNKGYDFQNRDHDGNLLPTKWNSLTTENGWENRGTLTYSLNEMVNFYLWQKIGIPAPRSNWGHFRTITTAAEQPDPWHGDFWGLIMIHEDYDSDFLDSHHLEKGNLYKLTRDATDGPSQQRYQAADAVSDGSDHQNIYANLVSTKGEPFIERYVNVDKWSYYHALCHAVRHYDYWPTGDNNAAYYFEPDRADPTNPLGKLWVLPNDVDATWGPTWNEGKDRVWSAIFDAPSNPGLYPKYFNAVREVRDLLWQPDQINPLLDRFAAVIAPFLPADSLRWKGAPQSAGNYNGLGGAGATSLANLVTDMKNFAWVGGSWPGGNVGAGGTAALMDQLQRGVSNSEGSSIPATPVIHYQGAPDFPADRLQFGTSAFSDPQGSADFAAIQWRVAEVTDPAAPTYNAATELKLEWTADYDSGPLASFSSSFQVPPTTCKPGHAYRVRVRHQDASHRWSHWSAPVQFVAAEPADPLKVVISEFLYKPSDPTAEEIAAGFTDPRSFEFVEIRNLADTPADLSGCYFDKGITFTFPPGSTLAPGASTLVVPNTAAFEFRYGEGRPMAGTYSGALDNAGERLLLVTADQTPLVDFTYKNTPDWPSEADTHGASLILINPAALPDPKLARNWRASRGSGGAPGFPDEVSFTSWATAHGVTGSPSADDDDDGLSNALEYALLTDPHTFTPQPAGTLQEHSGESYLTTSFRRQLEATDFDYHVSYSENLTDWEQTAVRVRVILHYDGSSTETWRAPVSQGNRGYLRIAVSPREPMAADY
jgi:hypothetical protein